MNKSSISFLLIAALVGVQIPVSYATEGHWAQPILETLQAQSYYTELDLTDAQLSGPISGESFYSLLTELAQKNLYFPPQIHPIVKQKTLTRYDAAVLIYQLFKKPTEKVDSVKLNYKDLKNATNLQLTAAKWHQKYAVMKGTATAFKGSQTLTIGEGVAIMNQLKSYLKSNEIGETAKVGVVQADNLTTAWQPTKDQKYQLQVAWGEKSTGGYSVTIEKAEVKEQQLLVYVKLKSPEASDMVTQAFTYPTATLEQSFTKAQTEQLVIQIVVIK